MRQTCEVATLVYLRILRHGHMAMGVRSRRLLHAPHGICAQSFLMMQAPDSSMSAQLNHSVAPRSGTCNVTMFWVFLPCRFLFMRLACAVEH